MPTPKKRPVYLSPHLDDAVLSCGGTLHQQARLGACPLVITCFAGVPDYGDISSFAAIQHRRWGHVVDAVQERRREDAAALSYLGAELQQWDYLDCIYRRVGGRHLYETEESLFGAIRGEDESLIGELTATLANKLPPERVVFYAPLAVGHHVDHQLVFLAALGLRARGWPLRFFADYPYAESNAQLSQALGLWEQAPAAFCRRIRHESLEARIAAVRAYRSQLSSLFGDESRLAPRLKAYALKVGAGHYAERFWKDGRWRAVTCKAQGG